MTDYDYRLTVLIRSVQAENDSLRAENEQLKTKLLGAAQALKIATQVGPYTQRLEREVRILRQRLDQPETFTPRQGRDRSVIEGPLTPAPLSTRPGASLLTDSNVQINSDGPEDWTDE